MSADSDITARMKSLEERIVSLEASCDDTKKADIALILKEFQEQAFAKIAASSGDGSLGIKQERDNALAEVARLKKENERLEYRVRHLIKALNEEELKSA